MILAEDLKPKDKRDKVLVIVKNSYDQTKSKTVTVYDTTPEEFIEIIKNTVRGTKNEK